MQPKYLQNRKGSQGVPCSPQKKGSSLMVPFFVQSKGGKCAAFSFPTPIPTFPEGEGLVASCRSSERGVRFEGYSSIRAAVDSGARFGCAVADGRWLAPRGWVTCVAFICVAATAVICVIWCRCGGVFLTLAAL